MSVALASSIDCCVCLFQCLVAALVAIGIALGYVIFHSTAKGPPGEPNCTDYPGNKVDSTSVQGVCV